MQHGFSQEKFSLNGLKVFVAGHNGMVGGAMLRALKNHDCSMVFAPHSELDLINQAQTAAFFKKNKPDVVVLAAARVGGIKDNADNPAPFFYDNMMIAANVIHAAYESSVKKLLYLGSSCIYPKDAINPIAEDALFDGTLEQTNEAYALAKIGGLKMCEYYRRQYGCDFISAMPCNLYGPGDTFDAEKSHVIPALIKRFHEAKEAGDKEFFVWGTGAPLREFLYVEDLAEALVFLLEHYSGGQHINVGAGQDISIADLSCMVADVVGYKEKIVYDSTQPDGTMRKLMDSSRLQNAGWSPKTDLETGLKKTYEWFLKHHRAG